jgi:hypothetical protein
LFNGTVNLSTSTSGPNPHEYIYTGSISNSLLAPAGRYKMLIAAWDQATGINLYKEKNALVRLLTDEGNLIWAKRAGGGMEDVGKAITTLSDDSTVVTGYLRGVATFGQDEIHDTFRTAHYFGLKVPEAVKMITVMRSQSFRTIQQL